MLLGTQEYQVAGSHDKGSVRAHRVPSLSSWNGCDRAPVGAHSLLVQSLLHVPVGSPAFPGAGQGSGVKVWAAAAGFLLQTFVINVR